MFSKGLASMEKFSSLNDSRILKPQSGVALPEVLSVWGYLTVNCYPVKCHQPNATELEHSKFSRTGWAGAIWPITSDYGHCKDHAAQAEGCRQIVCWGLLSQVPVQNCIRHLWNCWSRCWFQSQGTFKSQGQGHTLPKLPELNIDSPID